MKRVTFTIIFVTPILALTLILSPLATSISNNPCERCHSDNNYYQYLDIMEGAAGNQFPSTLNLNQTAIVTVVIQNSCNAPQFSILYDASVTLTAADGHFSVNNSTFNIADFPVGNVTVTWQITGVSEGFDYLVIDATASNPHFNIQVSDTYFPYPLLTVGQPAGTPPPPTTAPATSNYSLPLQIISVLAIISIVFIVAGVVFKRRRKIKINNASQGS